MKFLVHRAFDLFLPRARYPPAVLQLCTPHPHPRARWPEIPTLHAPAVRPRKRLSVSAQFETVALGRAGRSWLVDGCSVPRAGVEACQCEENRAIITQAPGPTAG